jgi:hypothetical protein
MTITTVAINCDIGLADNSEFTAASLTFTLSEPDYDTVSNDVIVPDDVSVTLTGTGTGTANLWPVTRGTRNSFYAVTVTGSRLIDGRTVTSTKVVGIIRPPATGAPFTLADLLAQSSGGIVAGSTIYATLADAVAAALAAAAQAELIAGGVLDDDLLPLEFASRAALVAAVAGGLVIVPGVTYRAGGLAYRGQTGATAIADLPGLVPNGDVTPSHFGAIAGQIAVDDSPRVQDAMDWCGANGRELIFDAVYRSDGVNQVSNLVCRGTGGGGIVSYQVKSYTGGTLNGQHVVNGDGKSNFAWIDVLMDNSVNTLIQSGLRTFSFYGCSDYLISGCRIKTLGAAVGSVNCHHYVIRDTYTTISGTWTDVQHDGIIDQWWGSHDFEILNNRIEPGNFTPRWPILVTGTQSAGGAAKCYNGKIIGNYVKGFIRTGIWVMGRSGGCDDFVISDNTVEGNGQPYESSGGGSGIIVTEATGFTVTGNITRNTPGNGIRIATEPGSYTPDQIGGVVSGNVVIDANATSQDAAAGAAILVDGDSRFILVGSNAVVGSLHTYPVFINGGNAEASTIVVGPGAYQNGTLGGVVFNGSPVNSGGVTMSGSTLQSFAAGLLRAQLGAGAFDVFGHTTENQAVNIGRQRTGDGLSEVALFPDNSGSGRFVMRAYAGAAGARELRASTGAMQFVVQSENEMTFLTNNIERMRVTGGGRVGIGGFPAASAALDVTSTTGGLRLPNMTTTQRDAIASPANGLLIYNTTIPAVQARVNNAWVNL